MTLLWTIPNPLLLKEDAYILDNIFVVEELIFSLRKRWLLGHIIKVDFAKAFDTVDWEFLIVVD